jgi:hypothetical protein
MGVAEASSVAVRNLGGRPEKYKPEYCDQLVEFFLDAAKLPAQATTTFEIDGPSNPATGTIQKGQIKQEVQAIVAVLPTFNRFAMSPVRWRRTFSGIF